MDIISSQAILPMCPVVKKYYTPYEKKWDEVVYIYKIRYVVL